MKPSVPKKRHFLQKMPFNFIYSLQFTDGAKGYIINTKI